MGWVYRLTDIEIYFLTIPFFGIFSILTLLWFFNYFTLVPSAKITALRRQSSLLKETARLFNVTAAHNARCDKMIFENLNELILDKKSVNDTLEKAITLVNRNISDLLNILQQIMSSITGSKCAVCLKIVDIKGDDNGGNVGVLTLARDSISRVERDMRPSFFSVDGNTINRIVIGSNGISHYISNDLLSEGRDFITESQDWKSYYNATLVVGVPELDPNTAQTIKLRGLLCCDNKDGGFDESYCLSIMKELSWRFSVMLYRLDGLAKTKNHLTNTTHVTASTIGNS